MNTQISAMLAMRMMAADIIAARIIAATARRGDAPNCNYVSAFDGWLAVHEGKARTGRDALGSILRMARRLVELRRLQVRCEDAGSSYDADRMMNEGGAIYESDGSSAF